MCASAAAVQNQGEPGKTVQPRIKSSSMRRRHNAPAQVVEELPALEHRQRIVLASHDGSERAARAMVEAASHPAPTALRDCA